MCIPTFVDFFLFNLFFFSFSLFLSFSFSFFSFLVARRVLIAFFFFLSSSSARFPTPSSLDSFLFFFSSGFFFILVNGAIVKRYPLTPPHYLSLLTMSSYLPAGDQLVVWGGNAHFFTYTWIRSRETGEDRRTNEQTTNFGVTKSRGRYATLHAYAFLIVDIWTIASVGY